MPALKPAVISATETAKYYCTLSTMEYVRPDPFGSAQLKPLTTWKLPLPLELRDETRVDYNNVDMVAVGDLINTGGNTLGAEALRQAGTVINEGIGAGVTAIGAMFGPVGQSAGQYVGGKLQQAFPAEAIGSAIEQSLGVAPNPNPAVAFKGVPLREVTLTWTFMPASRKDAEMVRRLIKYLKGASLPKSGNSGASILGYPRLAQLNFFPWDATGGGKWGWGENSIIKMKQAFMASVNVDYSSGVAPAFFHDGNFEPVVTRMTINFKEVEYFLSHDYGGGYRNVDVSAGLAAETARLGSGIAGVAEQEPQTDTADETEDAADT